MQLVDCASGMRRDGKNVDRHTRKVQWVVNEPAALADEEQAKGYPKSDTVANRR